MKPFTGRRPACYVVVNNFQYGACVAVHLVASDMSKTWSGKENENIKKKLKEQNSIFPPPLFSRHKLVTKGVAGGNIRVLQVVRIASAVQGSAEP